MKKILWQDKDGRNHAALVRDTDTEEVARAGQGIPLDPPDVRELNWEAIKTELHNELLQRGLTTLDDVKRAQNGVTSTVTKILKRHIVLLYRRLSP